MALYEVSESEPLKLVRDGTVTSITLPSCNRVEGLKKALTSYLENSRRYCRKNEFVIGDDSLSVETRAAYKSTLKSLKQKYGVGIRYAGLEEKLRYARKLIERGGLKPDAVKFALFDSEKVGLSTLGSNRNALMLDTVGEMILTVDDDSECRLAPAPEMGDGLAFVSENRFSISLPCEVWTFPDREAALSAVEFIEQDILALHEEMLGKKVGEYLASFKSQGRLRAEPGLGDLIRQSESNGGRIVVTMNGIIGDCAWGSPSNFFLLTGESFERLTKSESWYRTSQLSREMLRVAPCKTISRNSSSMTMFAGIDNRDLLPPFLPVTRCEDVVFGVTLGQCFDDAYIAYLPWALLHIPVETRSFSRGEIIRSGSGIDFMVYILTLLRSLNLSDSNVDQAGKLQRLGKHLEALGRMNLDDFRNYLRERLLSEAAAFISHLESRINTSERRLRSWVNDIERYIDVLRKSTLGEGFDVPMDLLYSRRLDAARSLAQRLVLRFGELLYWWPEMVDVARKLRAEGERVAQPV